MFYRNRKCGSEYNAGDNVTDSVTQKWGRWPTHLVY